MLGDPSEFEVAWAKSNPVRRKCVNALHQRVPKCNILRSYTAGSVAAPRTAHTAASAPLSLAAATLPTTAHTLATDGAVPKARS